MKTQDYIEKFIKAKLQEICDELADTHEVEYDVNMDNPEHWEVNLEARPYRIFQLSTAGYRNKTVSFEDIQEMSNSHIFHYFPNINPCSPQVITLICSTENKEIGTWSYIHETFNTTLEGDRILNDEAGFRN